MSAKLDTERVQEIFHQAINCDSRSRAELLARACGDDTIMRTEVESLLRSFQQHQDFLQSPVFNLSAAEVIAHVLDESQKEFSLIGQRIGPYRLIRQIGRGGMGAVYLAERDDSEYTKVVAIKLIRNRANLSFISGRFRRERQILADLDHPNIARLIDGGTTPNGLPYLVMEHVDGVPIDQYADEERLSTTQRLELFRKVCAAVIYAHKRFVIHRDIKPSNILVSKEGTPKLLDFGIAKLLDPTGGDDRLDATTALQVMTPEYASPEQVRGEAITVTTDVYSLGVVLYELLTGHHPYRTMQASSKTYASAMSNTQPEKPSVVISRSAKRPPSSGRAITPESVSRARATSLDLLKRSLRGDMDTIVLTALRKEPERRYNSVEQFSEDIRRHLQALPIIARGDSLTYRTRKFLQRNSKAAALIVVIAVACLLLGAVFTLFSVRAKPKTSIAVLPFVNSIGDPNMDYFCEGLTDNLMNELSHIPGLKVPGHGSVVRFKGKSIDLQSAAKQLEVESVVTGDVSTNYAGDILVNVILSDSTDGRLIFTRQYQGKSSSIREMQAQISQDVSNHLGWKLEDDPLKHLRGTQSAKAYDLYLKASYSWNQRNPEALETARNYYRSALQEDPKFALAYSGLANCLSLDGAYLIFSPDDSFGKAKEFANKAIENGPTLPEGHTSLALIHWLYDWDWNGAEREFKTAIELDPNYPLAHHWYGLFLGEMNRPGEAIAEEQRALQLDQLSLPIMADLARVYFFARRYDDSLAVFTTAKNRLLGAPMGDFEPNLEELYEQKGDIQELSAYYKSDVEMQRVMFQGGMTAYWQKRLDRIRKHSFHPAWEEGGHFDDAKIYARVGQNDRAIEALNKAYQTRNHLMTQLKVNPAFDGLRSDPRFSALLRRMSLESS